MLLTIFHSFTTSPFTHHYLRFTPKCCRRRQWATESMGRLTACMCQPPSVTAAFHQRYRHTQRKRRGWIILVVGAEVVRSDSSSSRRLWEHSGESLRQDLNKQRRWRWPERPGTKQRAPWQNKAMRDHTLSSPDQPLKCFDSVNNFLQTKWMNKSFPRVWRHVILLFLFCIQRWGQVHVSGVRILRCQICGGKSIITLT